MCEIVRTIEEKQY